MTGQQIVNERMRKRAEGKQKERIRRLNRSR